MFRKIFALAAIVLIVGVCNLQAAQIASTWTGGSQGEWGNAKLWADPCNWNPAIVPDNDMINTFAVTIDAGGDVVQIRLQQERTIDRLDCYGNIRMYMGDPNWIELTLNEPNGLTNYGEFTLFIHGSEFDRVVGNITNRGIMELRSSIGYIMGNVTNADGAELILTNLWVTGKIENSAGGLVDVERSTDVNNVENAGSIVIIPTGDLATNNTLHNTGEIQIYGGLCESEDVFHNDIGGIIKGFGVLYAEQLFQNEGQIIAFGGPLSVASDGSLTNTGTLGNMCLSTLYINPTEDVNNQGNITIKPGGGIAFDCHLINEPNATIQLNGGTLALNDSTVTQQAGATFEGFGTISGGSGGIVIKPDAEVKLTASTNIVGNVEINEDATLEISDGVTLVTGQTVCDGTIHMKGGYIVPQGGLSGNCDIIWEHGLYTNASDFNLDGQVNFEDFAYMADTWLWQTAWQ